MNKYCLYAHLNPLNNKCYIGITKDVEKRWIRKEESYKGSVLIYKAFKKYGWDNFVHAVLFGNMTKERACQKEKEWIYYFKRHNLSYNITDGGEGVCGLIRNTKRVFVYSKQGELLYIFKSERDAEMELFGTRAICSGSISNVCRGRKKSYKGYVFSSNPLEKDYFKIFKEDIIEKYDLNNNLLKSYIGWKDIKNKFGDVRNIASCLSGHKKTSYGFKWKRYEAN